LPEKNQSYRIDEEMKIFLVLLFLSSIGRQALSVEVSENWFFCEKSSECILAVGKCGVAVAINSRFQRVFENRSKETPCDLTIDFSLDKKGKISDCVKGRCQVVKKVD
jgi:hypothetical protein